MFIELVNTIVDTVSVFGYLGIVILMLLESSFLPFPSEIVIIPAGYLVTRGEMDFSIVIICGVIGSLLGALLNYFIALLLDKKLKKYQRYFLLNDKKYQKIQDFFAKHGHISTFIGRLIPVIRQYISFPAGLIRMDIKKFCVYTSLGAGIWVYILAYIGVLLGNVSESEYDKMKDYYLTTSLHLILLCLGIIVFIYIIIYRRKKLLTD